MNARMRIGESVSGCDRARRRGSAAPDRALAREHLIDNQAHARRKPKRYRDFLIFFADDSSAVLHGCNAALILPSTER
jgi:hypothetical protein